MILEKAKKLNSRLYKTDLDLLTNVNHSSDGTEFWYKDEKYFIPLLGKHQVENSILAMNQLEFLIN